MFYLERIRRGKDNHEMHMSQRNEVLTTNQVTLAKEFHLSSTMTFVVLEDLGVKEAFCYHSAQQLCCYESLCLQGTISNSPSCFLPQFQTSSRPLLFEG